MLIISISIVVAAASVTFVAFCSVCDEEGYK